MQMKNDILLQYAKKLSRNIDDRKARADTQEEIYTHLCDLKDGYIQKGLSESTAEQKALGDMKSPEDLGIQLDKVHTPKIKWWVFAVIILALLGIIAAVMFYISNGWDNANRQPIGADKEPVSSYQITESRFEQ